MAKFVSLFIVFFKGVGEIFGLLKIMELKSAGREELDNEILKKENRILKKQRDNDIHSVADADELWNKWDNDK